MSSEPPAGPSADPAGPAAEVPTDSSGVTASPVGGNDQDLLTEAGTATSAVSAPAAEAAAAPASDPATHRFECRSCGFVYDPAEGVRKLAIEAGTPFLELDPLSFRCPVCRSRVGAFKDIGPRNKPSGFEENLNFGLGVNRLTPGQKNVLIFGAFALAIAFFLSLYSLR